jgi:hypothetical protein
MSAIRALKPNVTGEEAIHRFRPSGVWSYLGSLSRGPLRLLADVYVPFRLFRVEIRNGPSRQSLLLGLDAVRGELDPYRFDVLPTEAELIEIETRNRPEAMLDPVRSRELIIEKAQRLAFSSGFFRIRNLQICAQLIPFDLHVPYWLGFYGAGARAHVSVLDAVRRRFEGAKARQFFCDWLADGQADSRRLSSAGNFQS